jgi:hypothetical protein
MAEQSLKIAVLLKRLASLEAEVVTLRNLFAFQPVSLLAG